MSAAASRQQAAVDIFVERACWNEVPAVTDIVLRAIAAAAPATEAELSIVLTDDDTIRALNRQWRGQDKPTNVLSFPAPAVGSAQQRLLGDIVIAYQTTAREAKADGKALADHVSHLAVHGLLHLLGFDHETDADAEVMEREERRILQQLGIADPYASRDGAS